MKNYIKSIAAALSSIALLAACNDVEQTTPDVTPDSQDAVSFSSSITTRVLNNQFQAGDQIFVQSYDIDSNAGLSGVYSYDAGEALFSAATDADKITRIEGESLSYFAVYPADYTNLTSGYTFSVQTDQSNTLTLAASQLMFAQIETASEDQTPELIFENQMAKVEFTVMVDLAKPSDATISTLFDLNAEALVNVDLGTVLPSTMGTSQITPYANNYTYHAVVAPQNISSGAVIATVTYDSKEYTWSVSEDVVMESGAVYQYTMFIDSSSKSCVVLHEDEVDEYIENGGGTVGGGDGNDDVVEDAAIVMTTTTTTLDGDMGKTASLAFTTNQSVVNITNSGEEWLSASAAISGTTGTLSLETLSVNTSAARTATIVITVGEGDNTAQTEVTVTQSQFVYTIGDIYTDPDTGTKGIIYYSTTTEVHVMSIDSPEDIIWSTLSPIDIDYTTLRANANIETVGYGHIVQDAVTAASGYTDDMSTSTYPLFTWAESLGQGWYIPTIGDYGYIYNGLLAAYTTHNATMVAAGGAILDIASGTKCWTNYMNSAGEKAAYAQLSESQYKYNNTSSVTNTGRTGRAVKYIKL